MEHRQRAFAHNQEGLARIAAGDAAGAAEAFAAALACEPRFAPALTNLGNLRLEAGDLDGAIARFEEALSADPDYPEAYYNLAIAYRRQRRFAAAVRAHRRAAALALRRQAIPRRGRV